jgi:tetratricopeptide (TPR) repeat protein
MPGFKWSFELRSDHCLPFDCFERASGCDFDRYTRLRFEAYCALENADFVKAVELARMARRMFEKDGSVCRLEGIGCSSLGDTAHAFEAFSAAIALNGRDIDSLLYRGYIFLERDEYIAALRDFNRCLGLDAGCLDAAKGAVRALIGLKKPKPAQERLIKLRKAYPCDLELDLLLCKVAPKTMSDIMAQKTSGKIQVKRPKLWVDIITAILILAGIMASGIVISLVVILIDSIIKSL